MPYVFLPYSPMCVDAFAALVAVAPPAFAAPLCVLIVGRHERLEIFVSDFFWVNDLLDVFGCR